VHIFRIVPNVLDVLISAVGICLTVCKAVRAIASETPRVSRGAELAIAIKLLPISLILLMLVVKPMVNLFDLGSCLTRVIFWENLVCALQIYCFWSLL
jgi:hypothetical protein